MTATTTEAPEPQVLPEGVIVAPEADPLGRPMYTFTIGACPDWCDEKDDHGAQGLLADLNHWYYSRSLILTLHPLGEDPADPEAVQLVLRQNCTEDEPRLDLLLKNADVVMQLSPMESVGFAYLLHEVLSMTDGGPLLPTRKSSE
jgi:hypothetical protein